MRIRVTQHDGTARVRSARPDDAHLVLATLESAGLPTAGVGEVFANFHVAAAGDGVVGAAGFERFGDLALLRSVIVVPAWRARGLGTALVEAVMEDARTHGARAIYLLTTTAQAFFAQRGFRSIPISAVPPVVRESVEFASGCCNTAVCMGREMTL